MDDIEDTNYKFYSQDIENIWYIFFCLADSAFSSVDVSYGKKGPYMLSGETMMSICKILETIDFCCNKDTEESKWINLCENINKEYPDVVIELWDEISIQEKLCLPETQGCYKYWFECSDVFETEILTLYQRAINSWAKPKYMGYIKYCL